MQDRKLPLSTSDFRSGRFDALAIFVRQTWPFSKRPTPEGALDLVAQTFGYSDYLDAARCATERPMPNHSMLINPVSNLTRLLNLPKKDLDMSRFDLDMLAQAFGSDPEVNEFFKSWPMHLISRWNFENAPCNFQTTFLGELEPAFERAWSNNSKEKQPFATVTKNSTSAASIVPALVGEKTINELRELRIIDVIDAQVAEAILQDTMPVLFSELLCVNETSANDLIENTGLSMKDLWSLPRNESGFPNLYQHMRTVLNEVILNRPLMSLYELSRSDDGFYYTPYAIDSSGSKRGEALEEGTFVFDVVRDEIENDVFRTYTWYGQIQNEFGAIMAYVTGTYIAGPAQEDASSMDLISALDEMSDRDVEIIDIVLDSLQHEILENSGDVVNKSDINTRLLFNFGNMITISEWERSENATHGIGITLLNYCIDRLKKSFKRNMHVATIINPYQYKNDSGLFSTVAEQRIVDVKKVVVQLSKLRANSSVLNIYARSQILEDTENTFHKYCGEQVDSFFQ
jgi:hypothetical protein